MELSYGAGKVFIVPHEKAESGVQGGMCDLAVAYLSDGPDARTVSSGQRPTLRLRHVCLGRQPNRPRRLLPRPLYRQAGLCAAQAARPPRRRRDQVLWAAGPSPGDRSGASGVRIWSLKRTANYGSAHHDERPLRIASASLAADGRSVFLELPDIEPTWCMAIEYRLKAADGAPAVGEVHNTIHRLSPRRE